jgi:chromosome segregation ATPase
MAKVHRSYRLDEDVIARVDSYASTKGIRQTEAVELLLTSALDDRKQATATAENASELTEVLQGNLADLRRSLDTLAAQLEEKDRQIEKKDLQIEALNNIADHAQALQAADKQLTTASNDTKPGHRKLFGHWFSKEDK